MEAKIGDEVRAFHPGMLGVIKHGTVTKVGSKYATIDFGLTGTARVPFRDVTEVVKRAGDRLPASWTA